MNKIPRKYDFTKKWPSLNYESLKNEHLEEHINEIDQDTKKFKDIVEKWPTFLKEFGKQYDEYYRLYDKAQNFYIKHLVRKHFVEEETTLIFFKEKFNTTDLYFDSHENEKKFLNIYERTARAYTSLYKFLMVNCPAGNYFFPTKSEHSNFKQLYNWSHGPINNPKRDDNIREDLFMSHGEDVLEFSEKWKKTRKVYYQVVSRPRTIRTYELMEKLNRISIDTKAYEIEFPNIPNFSYAKWYAGKVIDENNRVKRNIELVIRSRKRSVELANNPNYIYVMSNEGYPKDTYKIGWTSRLPEERAEDLSTTGVIYDFKVEYETKFKDAEKIEKKIHKHFDDFRFRKNKEAFTLKLEKIIEYIESLKK